MKVNFNASPTAALRLPSTQESFVGGEDVKRFEDLLNNPHLDTNSNLVESILLGYQSHLNEVPPADALGLNPEMTLSAMQSIMKSVTAVEVTAKIAGSLTQSINRLVTMQ